MIRILSILFILSNDVPPGSGRETGSLALPRVPLALQALASPAFVQAGRQEA